MPNNNNKKVCALAFASGSESKEFLMVPFPRYIGVGAVKVIALNPSKAELERIYDTEFSKEPEYLINNEDGTKSIKLDFIIQTTDSEINNGIKFTTRYGISLKNIHLFTKDKSKTLVIDKYGQTGWVTQEEFNNKIAPEKNQRCSNDYRAAYMGEENLIKLLKTILVIPDSTTYKDGKWNFIEDLKIAEANIPDIDNLFTGDITLIRQILGFKPENSFKVIFGVKTTLDNRQYQTVYTNFPIKLSTTNLKMVEKDITENQSRGRYSDCEFNIQPLSEYKNTPTNFSNQIDDLPPDNPKEQTNSFFR